MFKRGRGRKRVFYDMDSSLKESWAQFHLKHALLESITKEEHARRTKRRLIAAY